MLWHLLSTNLVGCFGETVSRQAGALRHGRRISVQTTAAGQRQKTLSHGKAQAGRPVKSESKVTQTKSNALSQYQLPIRNAKPSKQKTYAHVDS